MNMFILILFLGMFGGILGNQGITLNSTNHVVVRGPIDNDLASTFVYNLNSLVNKDVFVYLDTPGGLVESGNK